MAIGNKLVSRLQSRHVLLVRFHNFVQSRHLGFPRDLGSRDFGE